MSPDISYYPHNRKRKIAKEATTAYLSKGLDLGGQTGSEQRRITTRRRPVDQ